MRRAIAFWLVVQAFAFLALGQAPAPTQKLPDDKRISFLQIQLHQKRLESDYLRLQDQMTKIQAEYTQTSQQLTQLTDEAYKEAKLDRKDWNLNLDKLEFEKIARPEEKKP